MLYMCYSPLKTKNPQKLYSVIFDDNEGKMKWPQWTSTSSSMQVPSPTFSGGTFASGRRCPPGTAFWSRSFGLRDLCLVGTSWGSDLSKRAQVGLVVATLIKHGGGDMDLYICDDDKKYGTTGVNLSLLEEFKKISKHRIHCRDPWVIGV